MVFLHKISDMVIFPRAKINIGLRITEKRPDGFHNLQTIFYPVCLCDAIEFVVPERPLKKDFLTITGLMEEPDPENNLVTKAIQKIREISAIPFLKVHLHKAIPIGAGLGGGSSDGATMLRCLNKYFGLEIDINKLKDIALQLGSDCPFFIENSPSYAEGRGEMLSALNEIPGELYLVLVNPGIHVSTAEAYKSCVPAVPDTDLKDIYNMKISDWKNLMINDFEEPIFRKYPAIGELKKLLYDTGALYSSMSGSGSTVYGIFSHEPKIHDSLKTMVIYSGIL
jgi:4-diphosphocytidyl-2-C-methyl-D-erythritol kinase